MSLENSDFERLKIEQQLYLGKCEQNLKQWEKFKEDYLNLKNRLTTLPNELGYEIMVPFGKFAFMPGKLTHTNEILVLLGDNWFVERSAKQACDIINRRLDGIEKHLEKIKKEISMFNEQLNWTNDLIKESKSCVNIEEKIEEAVDKKLEKKTPLNEDEKRNQRIELQNRAKLAQIKINERIKNDKLLKTNMNVKFESDESDDEDINEEETLDEVKNNKDLNKAKKKVRWSDDGSDFKLEKVVGSDENTDSSQDSIYESNEIDNFIKSNVIYIRHTEDTEIFHSEDDQKENEIEQEIRTPADIYKKYHKPKSILKNQNETESKIINEFEEESDSIHEKTAQMKFEPHKAFSGEIVEKSAILSEKKVNEIQTDTMKRISKFKASKQT